MAEQSRPDREKIESIAVKIYTMAVGKYNRTGYEESIVRRNTLEWGISEILALYPDIEQAKKEERERIPNTIQPYLHWHRGEWCFSPKKYAEMTQALKGEE